MHINKYLSLRGCTEIATNPYMLCDYTQNDCFALIYICYGHLSELYQIKPRQN